MKKFIDTLTDLIKNLGFPIVISLLCGFYIVESQNKTIENYEKREQKMYTQIDLFQKSLNDFNTTLQSIDKRLGVLEDEFK